MEQIHLFAIQFLLSLIAWGAIGRWVVAPCLKTKSLHEALIPLVLPHLFRHVGVSLLVSGLVAPGMPRGFALSTAIGDTLTQILAVLSLAALRGRWRHSIQIVWVFNTIGCVDMLYALFYAARVGAVRYLQAAWFGPTFIVPLMLVSHYMVFMMLLRRPKDVRVSD